VSASFELQELIYDTLVADAGVGALVGDRIYDAMPSDGTYPCLTFGPSSFVPDDVTCITGRVESVQIDCWSQDQGRLNPCKKIVDAVKGALHEADLSLTSNALVRIRVDLVRVFLDADRVTAHGVVQIEAEIEEAA
jgi:hypothetical protein